MNAKEWATAMGFKVDSDEYLRLTEPRTALKILDNQVEERCLALCLATECRSSSTESTSITVERAKAFLEFLVNKKPAV